MKNRLSNPNHLIYISLFFFTLIGTGCTKHHEEFIITYQLETSSPTGDHFYVNYINEWRDTISEHEHPGFNYSFKVVPPFSSFFEIEVNPIDNYVFTGRILVNGVVKEERSASTASGAIQKFSLQHFIP